MTELWKCTTLDLWNGEGVKTGPSHNVFMQYVKPQVMHARYQDDVIS